LNKSAPVYLHNMLGYATSITGHVGRNAHWLFVPQINTDYGTLDKACIIVESQYGMLCLVPTALCDLSSIAQFKFNYLRTF